MSFFCEISVNEKHPKAPRIYMIYLSFVPLFSLPPLSLSPYLNLYWNYTEHGLNVKTVFVIIYINLL